MSTIVDWHSHYIPERVYELLAARSAAPRAFKNSQGAWTLLPTPWATERNARVQHTQWYDIDLRLKHLDRAGVEKQLLSWPTTTGVDAFLPAADARRIWGAYNEEISKAVASYPDRLFGLAVLPTADIEWAARELERAHRDLGLFGAVLPVGGFQTLKAARRFAPVFEVAQKYRSHIYLHTGPANPAIPGQPPNVPHDDDDAPRIRWSLDTGAQFAAGTVTLTQTDFLDAYPDVTVQIAMLGGSIAFLAESIELRARGLDVPASTNPVSPAERFRRVYFDTGIIGRGPRALERAAEAFGADRILFGSDFPLIPDLPSMVEAVHLTTLDAEEKTKIYAANGTALLESKRVSDAADLILESI